MAQHTTDKTLAQDLDRLKEQGIDTNDLKNTIPRNPISGKPGSGTRAAASQSVGSGIASPLTETSRETIIKKIYDPQDNTSYIEVESITKLTMVDANGTEIIFNFTPQP